MAKIECPADCRPLPQKRSKPRHFTANDVARIYCHARKQGVLKEDIKRKIREKCEERIEDCDCEKVEQTIKLYQGLLAATALALAAAISAVGVIFARVPILRIITLLAGRRAIEGAQQQFKKLEKLKETIDGEYAVLERKAIEELTDAEFKAMIEALKQIERM